MEKRPNEDIDEKLSDSEACKESVNADGATLPSHALSFVLRYLFLEDRNRVRLTCKQWNGVCNSDPKICMNEKLVFWPTDKMCDVRKCLELSTKKILNVEFHTNHMDEIPKETWKICGEKLRSIRWFDGKYPKSMDKTVLFIVRYCSKLQHFSRASAYSGANLTLLSKSVLSGMVEKNVVCKNLECVSDSFDLSQPIESSVMFQTFPYISSLRIGKIKDPVVDLSKIPKTVNKLYLDEGPLYYPCHWLKYLNRSVKLKDLFLPLGAAIKNCIDQELLPFFAQQAELESVRLVIAMNNSTKKEAGGFCSSREVELYKSKVILHILRTCYRLKELSVEFFSDCPEEFKEETQPLEVLDADNILSKIQGIFKHIARLNSFRVVGFDYVDLLRPPLALPESSRLQSLQIPRTRLSYSWLLQCSMFGSLQCLELTACDIPLLDTISQFQVELRTLKINVLGLGSLPEPPTKDTLEAYASCLSVIPNASFPKLHHLDIRGQPHALLLLFLKFHFPVLKHLGLSHCCVKCPDAANIMNLIYILQAIIQCLPERVPTIQILTLNSNEYPYAAMRFSIVALASQRMPSLEILAFYSDDEYTLSMIKMFMNACPMLRLFIKYCNAFYFNRKTGKLEHRRIRVLRNSGFDEILTFQKNACCKLLSSNSWCL